jgi:LysM repeat protein
MRRSHHLVLIALVLFALTFGILGLTAVSADSPAIHVVSWGDTLFSIAARYGTTVNALMQANGIRNADFIYVGERLLISGATAPIPPSTATTYVVQSSDTLFSISMRYGTTVGALMQANGLYNYWIFVGQVLKIPGQVPPPAPLPVPQPVPAPVPQGVYHIVRPGEYLALIAARYGSSVYAIQMANKLPNPSFIWVGQRLFIPGGFAPINPLVVYNPLPPIYVPPISPAIIVLQPRVPGPVVPPYVPVTTTAIVTPSVVVSPLSGSWETVLITNTTGPGPCYLDVNVVGKADWPVVVATPDGSWISDPKLTGTKPEIGPYVVEFAHACTGVWRVIPLGLNTYADVELKSGHAFIEFRQRP